MSLREHLFPVFISPSELIFYLGNPAGHKLILQLFNPYDFAVKYQVYTNTTDKYGVMDATGSIAPHASVDLLVRHKAPFQSNCHAKDKFMITMLDATTNQILGKRYILATLLPGDPPTSSSKETSFGDDSSHLYGAYEPSSMRGRFRSNEPDPSLKNYMIILSVLFIIVLLMPTKCDEPQISSIPPYLHVTTSVKIIVSYVLGIITMALLKPC